MSVWGPAWAAGAAGVAKPGTAQAPARVQVAAAVEEEVPEGFAAAVSEDEPDDDVDDAPADEPPDSPEEDAPAFLPPSRKSVTYQPEPLSWKPAAVTCLA